MRWVAVRCCCQPLKVLGFFRVSMEKLHYPNMQVSGPNGPELFEFAEMGEYGVDCRYLGEVALKSENHPIEFWRNVQGFVEAHPPVDTRPMTSVSDTIEGMAPAVVSRTTYFDDGRVKTR